MGISAAQGPQDPSRIEAKGRTPSESKIWQVVKNLFVLSTLTSATAGGAAGLHLGIGQASLLMLVPGSGYALTFIPSKGLKGILIDKAKEVVKAQEKNLEAAAEQGVEKVVGPNRPDLEEAVGTVVKNGVSLVAHKVDQTIQSKCAAKGKSAKEPSLKDSPKPLNHREATTWINHIVDPKAYPALNRFFKEAADHKAPKGAVDLEGDSCYLAAMTMESTWYVSDPAYQLLLDLDAGIINPAAFMAIKDPSHELLQEFVKYKSDHFDKEQMYQLGQLVDPQDFPNLHRLLKSQILMAGLTGDRKAPIFEIITQFAQGNREGAKALGIKELPKVNEEFELFITEKEKANLLRGVELNMSVAKDALSLGAEVAKGAVQTQISESYMALSGQIDKLVDPGKYPDLNVYLHLSNDTVHKNAVQELKKVEKNQDNLLFALLDSFEKGNGVEHLKSLISMDKLPAEVLKDIMALGIEVGGEAAEKAIKECITEQIQSLYENEGEWTGAFAEFVSEKAVGLIHKLREKATKAVRDEHKKPGFYDRTMASWTMSGPWGSGAHLAFAKPESGVDVLVRLGAAMVGDGGLVSSAATELICNLIPEEVQNSTVSKKIAEGLQKVAEPAKAASEWIDETLGMTAENKETTLQAAATLVLSGEGPMSNFAIAAALPAVGAVLDHFGIADKKHFGEAKGFFTEETAIRITTGVVTTGVVEGYVRPTLGDEAASLTYVVSNLATTLAIPSMKESKVWKGVKNTAYQGSISVANHFMKPEEDESVSRDPWASYVEDATREAPKQAEEKPSLANRFWGWLTDDPTDIRVDPFEEGFQL